MLPAFTFAIAINRYDTPPALVLEEADATGTTYLRADILVEPLRSALIVLLRDYTQARIDFYEVGDDEGKLATVERRTNALQSRLWATTRTSPSR